MTPEVLAAEDPRAFVESIMLLIMLLTIRDMIWKGIALWKAGKQKSLARFVCIFIFNTAGILPIVYLIFFQKKEKTIKIQAVEKVVPKTIKKVVKRGIKK
jgi:hypothetical protein